MFGKMTQEASIPHFSFFNLIASWTALEVALDMYLICAATTINR